MKKPVTLAKLIIFTFFTVLSFTAWSQTATPFSGPSDANATPPASASAVGQVLCSGSQVVLKGPVDATGTVKYQWWKTDNNGTKKLVKEATDNTYTETSTDAGYYTYQLVQISSNNCSSEASDPFNVYVLPPLNPSIDATNATVCEKAQSNSTLTVQGLDSRFTYTYQWTRNGTNITTGGTSSSYTVTEQSAGNVNYGIQVAYTLNANCKQTATTAITVAPVPTKPTIQFGN